MNINKKPRYSFELFSALLAKNPQKSTKDGDKTSTLFMLSMKDTIILVLILPRYDVLP